MGQELVATVLPNLAPDAYEAAIANAAPRRLATAAVHARYAPNIGDPQFVKAVQDGIVEQDVDVIDVLAAQADAVEAIRAAARAGAHWIDVFSPYYEPNVVVRGIDIGLDDVLIVSGAAHGDDEPFAAFPGVVILASLLAPDRTRSEES